MASSGYFYSKIREKENEKDKLEKNLQELNEYLNKLNEGKSLVDSTKPKFEKVSSLLEHVRVSFDPYDEGYFSESASDLDKCSSKFNTLITGVNNEIKEVKGKISRLKSEISSLKSDYEAALKEEERQAQANIQFN